MELLGHVQAFALVTGTLVVGATAHELSHLVVLRLGGVSCTVDLLPDEKAAEDVSTGIKSPLARVRPTPPLDGLTPWHLRCAALMPLCLTVPLALILLGVLPDPFVSGELWPKVALVGWLACSIPSPQDFSLVWYPEEAIARAGESS